MIGRDDDDALVVHPSGFQRRHERAEAGVQPAQLRGDRRVKSGKRVGRLRLSQDVSQVQVLRQRIHEPGIRRRRPAVERPLEVVQHRAEVAGHLPLARSKGGGARRRDAQVVHDRVRRHRKTVARHFEQPPQGIHRRKRHDVLAMRQQAAAEYRRHGQPGAAVSRERIAEHQALRRERLDRRRERHAGVVRRQVIGAEAVDDEQENVRTCRQSERQRRAQVDGLGAMGIDSSTLVCAVRKR